MSGRGRGVFVRDNPGVLRDCVTGYSWVFDATCLVLKVWNGSAFTATGCVTQYQMPVSTGESWIAIPNGAGSANQVLTSNGASAYPTWQNSGTSTFTNQLTGLRLSNNKTDAVNDINISIGAAASDEAAIASRILLSLTCSGFTKQLDATWVKGSNVGGRHTGATAPGGAGTCNTYHVFVFQLADGVTIDAYFHDSPTASPPEGSSKRRIGSVIWDGATIVPFFQKGDFFQKDQPVLDYQRTNPGTNALTAALWAPTDCAHEVLINGFVIDTGGNDIGVLASDLQTQNLAANVGGAGLVTFATPNTANGVGSQFITQCDCSAQIRLRLTESNAGTTVRLSTIGWWDRRGQDT